MSVVLAIASLAFTGWMLADAVRRRVEFYWLLLIGFVPLVGPMIYFLVVKLGELDLEDDEVVEELPRVSIRPSLYELERRSVEAPSAMNLLALARELVVQGDYRRALDRYQAVLSREARCRESLLRGAECLLQLGERKQALELLTRLMDVDPKYDEFRAAVAYAETLWLEGHAELSLEVLAFIAKSSTRLEHRVLRADYLVKASRDDEAKDLLESSLEEFHESTPFVRERDVSWALNAERLLEKLNTETA